MNSRISMLLFASASSASSSASSTRTYCPFDLVAAQDPRSTRRWSATRAIPTARPGSTHFNPRSTRSNLAAAARSNRFNWATDSSPWKVSARADRYFGDHRASIGPRILLRGKIGIFRRGIYHRVASIGPRILLRGKLPTPARHPRRSWCFNWATDSSPWKVSSKTPNSSRWCFNWATDSSPWKAGVTGTTTIRVILLQLGHGFFSVERRRVEFLAILQLFIVRGERNVSENKKRCSYTTNT